MPLLMKHTHNEKKNTFSLANCVSICRKRDIPHTDRRIMLWLLEELGVKKYYFGNKNCLDQKFPLRFVAKQG